MTSDHSARAHRRRRWSLQSRLIATVVSIVSLILIVVGLATGATLGGIMRSNLDAQVIAAQAAVTWSADKRAEEILAGGRQQVGTLVVVENFTGTSGAYVDDDGDAVPLRPDQVANVTVDAQGWGDADIDDLGEYRVHLRGDASGAFVIVGMPTSQVSDVTARVLTTVALLTSGGLLVLAAVIAVLIRRELTPLRSVADTASRVARLPLSEGAVTIAERVPDVDTDDHTEIGRVGAALNTLLDHVDDSLAARQRNEDRMRAFVADASHELRTPLASIRGYSELSLRGIRQQADDTDPARRQALAETTRESLERIQAQSLRMSALVDDLLLLARLDEGTELVYGAVDLTRLAIDAVADARAAGPDHDWVLEVDDDPVVVAGDNTRLQQVAVNLLANARVHTPAGTRVTTTVTRDGTTAVLRVHDDGGGIPESIRDELFERFARGDASRARQTGGTGLGLSIAKAIVDAHGGEIRVQSEPGSTTFEVRLPARPPEDAGQ